VNLFNTVISPWLILFAGLLSSLTGLRELEVIKTRARLSRGLLVVPILIGVFSQLFQYSNVSAAGNEARAEEDRRFAFLLYAFMEPTTPLLDKVTSDARLQEYKAYSRGYQAFKHKQWDDAKIFLEDAQARGQFVAESNYLLAYMKIHDYDNCLINDADWDGAGKLLDNAIAADPAYPVPYYLHAIARLKENDHDGAIKDLKIAVTGPWGILGCYDVNDPREVDILWQPLRDDPGFKELARTCFDVDSLTMSGSSSGSQSCWEKSHPPSAHP
jgi:hypothetical protein